MLLQEALIGRPLEDVIRDVYDAGAYQRDVAEQLTKLSGRPVDESTVSRWMRELEIPTRRRGRGSAFDAAKAIA